MKKNILGAFVIIFIAVALFLMIDDIVQSSKSETVQKTEMHKSGQQTKMVTLDSEK